MKVPLTYRTGDRIQDEYKRQVLRREDVRRDGDDKRQLILHQHPRHRPARYREGRARRELEIYLVQRKRSLALGMDGGGDVDIG